MLSWSDKWTGTAFQGGVPFQWAADESKLSTSQSCGYRKHSNVDEGATKGQQRLDYIRGDRSLEGWTPGANGSSPSASAWHQGDIINSDVWYTGAPAANHMLKGYTAFVKYHKSRPGMLLCRAATTACCGFAAYDGQEKLAYVPRGHSHTHVAARSAIQQQTQVFRRWFTMTGDVDLNGGMQDQRSQLRHHRQLAHAAGRHSGPGGKGYFIAGCHQRKRHQSGQRNPGMSETNAAQLVKARSHARSRRICAQLRRPHGRGTNRLPSNSG